MTDIHFTPRLIKFITMKETQKQRIADAIEDQKPQDEAKYPMSATGFNNPPKLKNKSYEEIAFSKRIDIPICKKIPVNGRIFAIETAGSETKTDAGLILPHKYKSKKGEDMSIKDVNRYFVAKWDNEGIPEIISNKLHIGIEISPMIPQEAEEWSLPVIIDFETGNQFLVIHYTELGGISETLPEVVEK